MLKSFNCLLLRTCAVYGWTSNNEYKQMNERTLIALTSERSFLQMGYKFVFTIHNFYINVELSEIKESPHAQFYLSQIEKWQP